MKKKIFGIITLVLTMFALVTVSGCKQLLDEVNDAVSKATLVKVWKLTNPPMSGTEVYSYFDGNKMYAVLDTSGTLSKLVSADYTVSNGKITLSNVQDFSGSLSSYFSEGAVYDCTVTATTIKLSNGAKTIEGEASTDHSPSSITGVF